MKKLIQHFKTGPLYVDEVTMPKHDQLIDHLNKVRYGRKVVELIYQLKKHKIIIYYATTHTKT